MTESVLEPQEQIKSLWGLGGLGWRDLGQRVWGGTNKNDLFNRGYELAYNFLLAVFPALLFLFALLGMLAGEGSKLRDDLLVYLNIWLPPTAYDLIVHTLNEITRNSVGGKLTFGLLFALYSGSSGMTQLISTLNAAYEVREARSWVKVHLISLGLTLGISVLIIAALFLVIAGLLDIAAYLIHHALDQRDRAAVQRGWQPLFAGTRIGPKSDPAVRAQGRLLLCRELLQETRERPVYGGILGVFLAGMFKSPDCHVEQAESVGGLGHIHLRADIPGITRQHFFAVLQHLEIVARGPRGLELGLRRGSGDKGQPAAAQVVIELLFFGLAQGLAVDQIGGVEFAASDQQLNSVVIVPGRNDLVGALELPGCNAAMLPAWRRQRVRIVIGHGHVPRYGNTATPALPGRSSREFCAGARRSYDYNTGGSEWREGNARNSAKRVCPNIR